MRTTLGIFTVFLFILAFGFYLVGSNIIKERSATPLLIDEIVPDGQQVEVLYFNDGEPKSVRVKITACSDGTNTIVDVPYISEQRTVAQNADISFTGRIMTDDSLPPGEYKCTLAIIDDKNFVLQQGEFMLEK